MDTKINKLFVVMLFNVFLTACAGGGDDGSVGNEGSGKAAVTDQSVPTSLDQAAYKPGTTYEFGYNSIANIKITDAPDDVDYSRWAMLHDGSTYRLYMFKKDSNDTFYQFGYDGSSYKYGHNSIATLKVTNVPDDADTSRFAMLHDGGIYRLYLRSKTNDFTMYQFGFNGSSYAFGYSSIPVLFITGAPSDTDTSRWAMLYDSSTSKYRLYFGKTGDANKLYQFAYNSSSSDYEYGYSSIDVLNLVGVPATSRTEDFAMLHDRSDYRFYYLAD